MNVWVGVDIGKVAHHVVALDDSGSRLLSRRIVNDESDITAVVAEVLALGFPVCWAIDVTTGIAALLLAILRRHKFETRYVSGFSANQELMKRPGENKTDARDAAIIAHIARTTPDLPILLPGR
ncbi:IS110 family transposase [Allorhizocola rhizosphaerae]|uniref:IS110 family transposase n=1 Tax=Allorhizocola rhizosphaerae TaxID=1872709 RepID=UPI000E3BCA17|nr:transposase [Allorhizocola rhizosphaerae]